MKYQCFAGKEAMKWEKIFIRHPIQKSQELNPLMIRYAGCAYWMHGCIVDRKQSDLFAVEYVCAGDAFLIQDDKKYIIKKGETYLLRKNTNHSYTVGPSGILLKRYVVIDGIGLDNLLHLLNLWNKDHIILKEPKKFEKLMKQFTEYLSHTPSDESEMEIKLSSMAYELLLVLSKSIQSQFPSLVEKALEFMQMNLGQPLTLKQIAGHVGKSIPQFNRIFSFYLNCTPISYFLKQKMFWAANLLKTTTISVKEIAYMVGCSDPCYFSGQFKKHFGVSPKTYRSFRFTDEI
jgi:AraC-like DNA-binding protein